MGRPKSNTDKSYVSFRLTDKERARLDDFAGTRGITRTDAIIDAIAYYAYASECVRCGALNSPYGIMCSCCGSMLFGEHEIREALVSVVCPEYSEHESVKTVLQVMEQYQKKYGKLGCKISIEPVIDRTKKPTEYRVKLLLVLDDGKTKLLPEDNLDLVNNGVVIPREVLLEELMKHADDKISPELRKTMSEVSRYILGRYREFRDLDNKENQKKKED